MATSPHRKRTIDRSRDAVLEAVTAILVDRPDASLAEIAQLVGIGRTTLYRLFPTREAVLGAVARAAIDHLAEVYTRAGIPETFGGQSTEPESLAAFGRLVEQLIPLGPRLTFLIRTRELDADESVDTELAALDLVLESAVERGQAAGVFGRRAPASWLAESLYALVYVAWEQIENGGLAAREAPQLVMDTWLSGAGGREPRDRAPTA